MGDEFQIGHRSRLREKFLKDQKAIADYELLELLLYYSIPVRDTKKLAKELLQKNHNSLKEILYSNEAVDGVLGVGDKTKSFLLAIRELINRMQYQEIKEKTYKITSFKDLETFFKDFVGYDDVESLGVIFLDGEHKVIEVEKIFKGTTSKVSIYPREMIKSVLKYNSSAVVLFHNHPGFADIFPSKQDITTTNELINALKVVDVALLDHIIVSKNGILSMKKEKYF